MILHSVHFLDTPPAYLEKKNNIPFLEPITETTPQI
jgi:hypothetical protein